MKRRALLLFGFAAIAIAPSAGRAQDGKCVPHLFYLVPGSSTCAMTPAGEAFQQALSDLGYLPGRDIRWDRQCYQTEERLPDIVAEAVRKNPDIIFVTGTRAALAAKRATTTIPIIFAGVADPIASGLIVSLANPTGNITGVSNAHRDLNHKRFQLLKEAVPGITRVGLLLDPTMETAPMLWRDAEEGAHALALDVVRFEARSGQEIEAVFVRATRDGIKGMVIAGGGTFR